MSYGQVIADVLLALTEEHAQRTGHHADKRDRDALCMVCVHIQCAFDADTDQREHAQ